MIRSQPLMTPAQIVNAQREYRCRIESLLAIDEGVTRLVDALRASGELDNTLIIYTSDNGFFAGEHRIRNGKVKLYEESIHLPLLIRGPGFAAGAKVGEMATNADLAPTVLEAAGAGASRLLDGRPLQPFAAEPGRERGRELLVETSTYRAIRTRRYLYAEHFGSASAGETEMYDLFNDPYELQSLHADPGYADARAALAERLRSLAGCAGPSCRRLPQLGLKLVASRKQGRRCLVRPGQARPPGRRRGPGAQDGALRQRPQRRRRPEPAVPAQGPLRAPARAPALDGANAPHPARRPPPDPRHPPAGLPRALVISAP